MQDFAELLWVRVPTAVRRFSQILSMVFGDGGYLRAWPRVAAGVPVGAFVVGVFFGLFYDTFTDGMIYTYSVLAVATMAGLAAFGAGIGCAAWFGFVVTDLLFTDRTGLLGFDTQVTHGFWNRAGHGFIPLLAAYALLFGLLVMAPVVAAAFAARAELHLRGSRDAAAVPAAGALYVLVLTGLAFAWAHAVPVMVRPLWTFNGDVPAPDAIRPLQENTVLLAVVVGGAAIARIVVAAFASAWPGGRPVPLPARSPSFVAVIARLGIVPLQALFITLLLAGLITNLLAGLLFFLMILGILATRVVVIPMIPGYAHQMRRIPLLVRLVACLPISYGMTALVLRNDGPSFKPLLAVLVLSLAAAAVLLPGPPMEDRLPPRETGRHREPEETPVMYGIGALLALPMAYAPRCTGAVSCALGGTVALAPAGITLILLTIVVLPDVVAPPSE